MIENYFDHIDEYLFDRLNKADRKIFEEAMKIDVLLREEVSQSRIAKELGELHFEKEIANVVNQYLEVNPIENNKPTNKVTKIIMTILVVMMALLAWYFFSKPNTKTELPKNDAVEMQFASLYEEPIWPLERAEADSMQLAISLHLSDRTEESLAILKSKPYDLVYQYWLAEVLVHDRRCKEAEVILQRLMENGKEVERVKLLQKVCKYIHDEK